MSAPGTTEPERCPPGCAKCAADYLDAKEDLEAAEVREQQLRDELNALHDRVEKLEMGKQQLREAIEWARQAFYRQGWNAEGDFLSKLPIVLLGEGELPRERVPQHEGKP